MNQNYPKGGPRKPLQGYQRQFQQNMDSPAEPMVNNTPTSALDQMRQMENTGEFPQAVALPPHLFVPPTAQVLAITSPQTSIGAGATVDVITWVAPKSRTTRILTYSFFSENQGAVQIIPLVDGKRVLPYHGTPVPGQPTQNFIIRAGGFEPFAAFSPFVFQCILDLEPGQTMIWRAVNSGGAPANVQIKLDGYVDNALLRKNNRFGG